MSKKRATVKEVAAKAGVSTATVSNVFSGKKAVNDALKARVEKAAQELRYQVDRAAAQLRTGQANVVGVLVPDLEDAFFASLVSRLEVMAGGHGYDVIVASSRDDREIERSRLRALLAWRPAGIIAVPCSDEIPEILVDEKDRLPMVFADRVIPEGAIADTVTIDNRKAGEIAARHLIEMGHRDIALAASHLNIWPLRERIGGARDLIHRCVGAEPVVVELGSNRISGADKFSHWIERNTLPSAIIGLTNVTTLSVLSALANHRIEVSDQVSIIGFDDYEWMSARKTALTAIRQPIDEMARVTWERLMVRMAGDRSPARSTVLSTSLQVRTSVRRAPPSRRGKETSPEEANDAAHAIASIERGRGIGQRSTLAGRGRKR